MNAILEPRHGSGAHGEFGHHLEGGRRLRSRFRRQLTQQTQNAVAALRRLRQQARDLEQLQSLDEHLLQDIGLTRSDVNRLAAQPIRRTIDYQELERQRRLNSRRFGRQFDR